MKNYLFLFLFFLYSSSQAQLGIENKTDELGIGVIAFNNKNNNLEKLVFYKDKELKTPSPIFYAGIPEKKVFPKFYKPQAKICYFVCTENTNAYYKIVVNKSDEFFIANDTNLVFKTWDILFTKSQGVIRTDKQNLFRSEPSDMGAIVNLVAKEERYKVIEVKGEWLKVMNESKQKVAWIRCRQKDRFLLQLIF